jgi:hypothetical protein
VRDIERYTGEKVRIDVIPGLEPRARSEHEPRRKSGADWKTKPRGGQPAFGRKPEGAAQGGGWKGESRQGERSGLVSGWSKPAGPRVERSRGEVQGKAWAKPARPRAEAAARPWNQSDKPAWKKGKGWGEGSHGGAKRGQQDW